MKRTMYTALLFWMCIVALLFFSGCAKPTGPKQSPIPEKDILPGSGRVWIDPETGTVPVNAEFQTKIFINSGNQKIAAYGFLFTFSKDIMNLDMAKGNSGVEPGTDGYVAAMNTSVPGQLFVAGYDVYGKGPGEALHFLTINWRAVKKGETSISITVRNLVDETTRIIGNPVGISGKVVVQ